MSRPKLLWTLTDVLDEVAEIVPALQRFADVEGRKLDQATLLEALTDVEILVPRLSHTLDVRMFDAAPKLRVVATPAHHAIADDAVPTSSGCCALAKRNFINFSATNRVATNRIATGPPRATVQYPDLQAPPPLSINCFRTVPLVPTHPAALHRAGPAAQRSA